MRQVRLLSCLLLAGLLASFAPVHVGRAMLRAELIVTVTDKGFDVKTDSVDGGYVTVVFNNKDARPHQVQILRLREELDAKQALADLSAGQWSVVAGESEFIGGVANLPEKGKEEALLHLSAGNYLLASLLIGPDGRPEFMSGFAAPIKAHPGREVGVEPEKPNAEITMQDTAFPGIPNEVPPSLQIWKITNTGTRPHALAILNLNDGASVEAVAAVLLPPPGTPVVPDAMPATWAGGITVLSPGQSAWLTLDLEKGNYAIVSFVPDPTTGVLAPEAGLMTGFAVVKKGK